ncbi:MAG TPA: Rrf2 family transcriptional regulator [Ktedonobacteraceae bacterium]|nr:Rrf2 family transcriptional regulator [Ktedonobacteraceae bacterium]
MIATNSQFAIAIHILTLLAQSPDEPVTSERMAGSINTNPVFVRRILGHLSRAGLVASQSGVGGGWRLRREPAEITLLEVYQAVQEGHLLSLHHSTPNPDCLVGRNIQRSLMHCFGEAEQAFEQTLARQTVAQVLQMVRQDPSTQAG